MIFKFLKIFLFYFFKFNFLIFSQNSEDEGDLHPILVWIHGGSFLAGSSDTGIDMEVLARNLVFRNITFVSVNYRLGPLGFMSIHHSDGRVEGNFGLWDIQVFIWKFFKIIKII